jgi:hypothetical protein
MPKRFLAIIQLSLFFCLGTQAQVRLGIDAGPDFARILNIIQGYTALGRPTSGNYEPVTRIYGGIHADIPLDRKNEFIIRPALRYLGAGGKTPAISDYYGNSQYPATDWSFHYLNLPVQVLYSPLIKFGKPWIGGGIYSSLAVSGSGKTYQHSYSLDIGNSGSDAITRFDIGYIASAGFISKCGVLVGGDFQQSLKGIVPTNSFSYDGRKVYNSVWGVYIGYTWSLRRGNH